MSDINEAFEVVVNIDRRLLTPRQELWIAFNAGAKWALESIGAEHVADTECPGCMGPCGQCDLESKD